MLDNFKNRLRRIATEKQDDGDDRNEIRWTRDSKGRLVDEFGRFVAGNLEDKEAIGFEHT